MKCIMSKKYPIRMKSISGPPQLRLTPELRGPLVRIERMRGIEPATRYEKTLAYKSKM